MKKEELLEKIKALPDGVEVCIFDHRKNLHHANDEPQGMGIEKSFEVDMMKDGEPKPFAVLSFTNDDYESDGTPDYGSGIVGSVLNNPL